MSRPFFLPTLAPEAAGRRLARPAGRARSRAAGWLRSREEARRAGARIPYLGITTSLEGCQGNGLADAVLRRVLSCGVPVGTVVLDLGATATLEPETCAAILLVHQRLAAIGTRLRLAASPRGLADCLADAGVVQQLGPDSIHSSFRSAVLAAYAAQPGPGLAVGRIRTELEMQAENIEVLAPGSRAPEPSRTGFRHAVRRGWGACSGFTLCGWSRPAALGGGLGPPQTTCEGKGHHV